jgi:hypothetical protein
MPFPFKTVRAGERPKDASASRENALMRMRRDHSLGGQIAPPSAVVPSRGRGTALLFGKATATWTTGNLITLTPCRGPGDSTAIGANIIAYIYLPTGYSPKENQLEINADDILGYFPLGAAATVTASAVLLNPPLKTRTCSE